MRTWITTLVLIAAVGYVVSTCFVAVDETEFVIVKRFGKPVRTSLDPGLLVKWPVPIETVVRFDNRLQVFEDPAPGVPVKEYLTRDKKNVEVAVSTCWRIAHSEDAVLKFLETVRDAAGAEVRLADVAKSQLNAKLGSSDFETFVSTDEAGRRWTESVADVREVCAKSALDNFGIEIVDFRIQRLSFPAQNRRSVFERMRAERERIATQYRSEGDAEAMQIRAAAEAEQERILAEARAEYERIKGDADAEATRIYGEAYSADPEFYGFLRTLESYETGIDKDTVLVLPAESEFFRLLTAPQTALENPAIPMTTPTPTVETTNTDGETDARQPETAG